MTFWYFIEIRSLAAVQPGLPPLLPWHQSFSIRRPQEPDDAVFAHLHASRLVFLCKYGLGKLAAFDTVLLKGSKGGIAVQNGKLKYLE